MLTSPTMLPGSTPARRPPKKSPSVSAVQRRVLVVGGGMAAWRLCHALVDRHMHRAMAITIIGEEPRPAYDRVHLTDILGGRRPDDLLLAPAAWYADHGITLVTGDAVQRIDRTAKRIHCASGTGHEFDTLVLATGSRPFVPPIPGTRLPGVFVYRTIEDLEAIRAAASNSNTAIVIGGGLLGLESARALVDLGLRTTVIERGPSLLSRQLSPAAGDLLLRKVRAMGVAVITHGNTSAIEHNGGRLFIVLESGMCVAADLVVIAAGIRPRQELAVACGLACNRRGGIAIDDRLLTSDPSIHAIGECASHRDVVYGLVNPAYTMAEVLADRLAGRRRTFTGETHSARLKLLGVDVAALGSFQEDGELLTHRTADTHREVIFRRGRAIGAITVGPNPEVARLQDAVEARRWIGPMRRRRFAATGRLWIDGSTDNPAYWPPQTIVCNCRAVSRGTLSASCRNGCTSVAQLEAATGASSVCGSCRPLLAQLVGDFRVATMPVPGRAVLLASSLVACALAAGSVFMPSIPAGDSIEHATFWHTLRTEPFWNRVTGFTVLGIVLAGLAFSARKRIRRISLGNYGWWRALHAGLGLLGLVMLVAHTGLGLGNNLNRVLMIDFLALVVLGTFSGAVTALESRLDSLTARRLRTFWTWAHIVAAWPLPVLLLFHILSAFYFG